MNCLVVNIEKNLEGSRWSVLNENFSLSSLVCDWKISEFLEKCKIGFMLENYTLSRNSRKFLRAFLVQNMHRPLAWHKRLKRGFCRALEVNFELYNIGIREGNQVQGQGSTHPI